MAHHKGDFLKTLNFLQTMATFRPCPDCSKKGIVSPIVPRRITEEMAIWKCNSSTCIYPMSQNFEFFKAQFAPVSSIDERLFRRYLHYDVRSECASNDSITCSSLSVTHDANNNDKNEIDDKNDIKEAWKANNSTASDFFKNTTSDFLRAREQVRQLGGQEEKSGGQTGKSSGHSSDLSSFKQNQDMYCLSFISNAFAVMNDANCNKTSRKRGPPSILGDSATLNEPLLKRPASRSSVSERKELNRSALNFLRSLTKKGPTPSSTANFNSSTNVNSCSSAFRANNGAGGPQLDKQFARSSKLAKNLYSTTPNSSNSASFEPFSLSSASQQLPKTNIGSRKNFPGYVSRGLNNATGSETKSEDDNESMKRGPTAAGQRSTFSSAVKRTLLNNLKGVFSGITSDPNTGGGQFWSQNTPPTSVIQYEKITERRTFVTQTVTNNWQTASNNWQPTSNNWQPNVSSSSDFDFLVNDTDPYSAGYGLTADQKPPKDLRLVSSSASNFYSQGPLFTSFETATQISDQSPNIYNMGSLADTKNTCADFDASNLFDYTPNFEESSYLTANSNILSDNGLDYQQL